MQKSLLEDMMIFAQVVTRKSFTGAAKHLKLSNATVSKRIDRLEKSLQTRLLNRTTRHLSLTQAGEKLFYHCQQIEEQLQLAENEVSTLQTTPTGSIRVHCPLSFGHLHMVPALKAFMDNHPEISIDMSLGGNMTNLVENHIDVSIHIGEAKLSNMICKKLTTLSMAVCASPDYFAKHPAPSSPEGLSKHNCLIYREYPHFGSWKFIKPAGKRSTTEIDVNVDGNFHAGSSEALKEAAIQGLGVCMLPEFMLTEAIKSRQLISILPEFCTHDIVVYALYPHRKRIAEKIRLFVEALGERFSDDSYWH